MNATRSAHACVLVCFNMDSHLATENPKSFAHNLSHYTPYARVRFGGLAEPLRSTTLRGYRRSLIACGSPLINLLQISSPSYLEHSASYTFRLGVRSYNRYLVYLVSLQPSPHHKSNWTL